MLAKKIQSFLEQKLQDNNIPTIRDLALKTNTPYTVILELSKGYKANPELKTLQQIADAFNTSIDEVCGRDPTYYARPTEFRSISDEESMFNLKATIEQKILQTGVTAHKLGRLAGFSTAAISSFVGEAPTKKSLGSAIVIGVADHFKISIDEMIGRVSPAREQTQEVTTDKATIPESKHTTSAAITGLSQQDMEAMKGIRGSVASSLTAKSEPSSHTYTTKSISHTKPRGASRAK